MYGVGERVCWNDWPDEPDRTGVILEADERYKYYIIEREKAHAGERAMRCSIPHGSIIDLAPELPENVIPFRRNPG